MSEASAGEPEARPGQPENKPVMRGWLHMGALLVAIPAGVVLVLAADSGAAKVATAVYALSLSGMFAGSAFYHVVPWSEKGRARMKKVDHSMIYVLIAGTYTPFALLVIQGTWGMAILSIVWIGAAAGITLKLVHVDGFQRVSGTLYVVLGWLAILGLPRLLRGLNTAELILVAAGGITYTLGAVVLLRTKPDPSPKWFGYHEVWHVAVIVGCACFYLAMLLVVLSS